MSPPGGVTLATTASSAWFAIAATRAANTPVESVYPITTAGRLIGGRTMVVGISTFAIVTAKVAEFLVRSPTSDRSRDADSSEPGRPTVDA